MFQGPHANAFRFGYQLWEFRFGCSCCTLFFIFAVLLYVWDLGLTVKFRGYGHEHPQGGETGISPLEIGTKKQKFLENVK